jgi:hypothetical protein
VAYSPDGKTLTWGDYYGKIGLWDVRPGTRLRMRANFLFGVHSA